MTDRYTPEMAANDIVKWWLVPCDGSGPIEKHFCDGAVPIIRRAVEDMRARCEVACEQKLARLDTLIERNHYPDDGARDAFVVCIRAIAALKDTNVNDPAAERTATDDH